MDSREDEQQRGITMKSSSIALGYRKAGKVINSSPLYARRVFHGSYPSLLVYAGLCFRLCARVMQLLFLQWLQQATH